jgi:hypothetical protein
MLFLLYNFRISTSLPFFVFAFCLSLYSHHIGGASRTRTDHLLRARQALYQMSYGPLILGTLSIRSLTATARSLFLYPQPLAPILMVGLGGLEPPTSPLSGVRSNQLSYKPITVRIDSSLLSTKQIV